MTTIPHDAASERNIAEGLKSWVMVFLTLGFVILYGLALVGKLKPLPDASLVSRIEPIIFVIIGYYFGRLPAQQNEQTLKYEIARQTQRADAAQHAKEQALQSREALEEKEKNLRAALSNHLAPKGTDTDFGVNAEEMRLRHALDTANRILES